MRIINDLDRRLTSVTNNLLCTWITFLESINVLDNNIFMS